MFAVLKTGGKQYKVSSGDILRVEKLAAEAGETVQFNEILMVDGTIGTPLVEGAGVQAEVIEQIKGKKVIHFVKRRRKHSSKRTKGHRQQLTLLRVTDILSAGADASGVKAAIGAGSVSGAAVEAAAPAPKKAPAKKAEAEEPAAEKPKAPKSELLQIKGLGPKMAEKLTEAGVTTLAQVAAWSDADVETYEALLSELPAFSAGRIAKQDWIGQAKGLTDGD